MNPFLSGSNTLKLSISSSFMLISLYLSTSNYAITYNQAQEVGEIYFWWNQGTVRLYYFVSQHVDNCINAWFVPYCSVMATPRIFITPGTSLAWTYPSCSLSYASKISLNFFTSSGLSFGFTSTYYFFSKFAASYPASCYVCYIIFETIFDLLLSSFKFRKSLQVFSISFHFS